MPRRCRSSPAAELQRSPSTSTSPESASVSPSQISMVVVLPAPLGPSRPKHSPLRTSRLRPSTATTSLYAFRRLRTRNAAADGTGGMLLVSRVSGRKRVNWVFSDYMAKTPLAFLSYAHFDDTHENGKLRRFAERLSGEVRLQTGEEFPIFIDRNNLKWGQEWKARIDQSLDSVTFLIPILTPGYFMSESCRKELDRFVKREEQLERKDLILPIYYVGCSVLEDEAKRAADKLAGVLHERQYKDWRRLRHEPWTTPEVGRLFEQMALEVMEALGRDRPVAPTAPAKVTATKGALPER